MVQTREGLLRQAVEQELDGNPFAERITKGPTFEKWANGMLRAMSTLAQDGYTAKELHFFVTEGVRSYALKYVEAYDLLQRKGVADAD